MLDSYESILGRIRELGSAAPERIDLNVMELVADVWSILRHPRRRNVSSKFGKVSELTVYLHHNPKVRTRLTN